MNTLIGAFTVIICFFILGRKATEQERNSLKQLDTVIKLTEHIKNRIAVTMSLLPEIYLSFCEKTDDKVFAKALSEKGLKQALELYSLPTQAEELLDELVATLGRLDGNTQQEMLEITCKKLVLIRESEKERVSRKSKSVQALFSLAGALAVILMC